MRADPLIWPGSVRQRAQGPGADRRREAAIPGPYASGGKVMSHRIGYRRYGTPGEVVVAGPGDRAIVRTEFGDIPVTHRRHAPFAVGDYVVVLPGGIADVVPRTVPRYGRGVPVWVRFFAALAAPFRALANRRRRGGRVGRASATHPASADGRGLHARGLGDLHA